MTEEIYVQNAIQMKDHLAESCLASPACDLLSETVQPISLKSADDHVYDLEDVGYILVVDDEPALLNLFASFLTLNGLKSKSFTNGRLAVEWYRENSNRVNAIFLDMQMPIMSGSECFLKFRNTDGAALVVLMSGGIEQAIVDDLLLKGAARFVRKPLDYQALISWTLARIDAQNRVEDEIKSEPIDPDFLQ